MLNAPVLVRPAARRRTSLLSAAALILAGLALVAGPPSAQAIGSATGSIAVFGDNATDNTLSAMGYTTTLVTDAQVATPGFLDAFDAFYFTRNGASFGTGLSAAAAARVADYVGADGNTVLLNGDFADNLDPALGYDPEIAQLTGNAVEFAVASGHGFIGEFNGAVSALTSNSNGFSPIGLITGSAGPMTCCPADGAVSIVPAGVGHPVLDGVALPYNPSNLEFGAVMSGIASSLVLATYPNGSPAIVAEGTVNDPPTITVPSDMTVEGNTVGGANVTYAVTAADAEDGDLSGSVSCSPASGSFFALGGPATVTCDVTDSDGATASDSFTVTVVDTTAPSVTLVGGPADGSSDYFGSTPAAPTCVATDIVDSDVACNVAGYSSAVGTHTVTGAGTDDSGNTGSAAATYTVLAWTLNGFHQPVDMGGVFNVVKGGSTLPLKFEVFAGPTELTATSVVQSFRVLTIPCEGGAPTDDIEVTSTGGTSLRYDGTGGQFVQNWATPRAPGTCRQVVLTLQDGTAISANVKLK